MRQVKGLIVAAALVAAVTACGSKDSDGDGDKKKNDGTGGDGGAIPGDFSNTAGSKAEFSGKLDSVKTEVVDSAGKGLGFTGPAALTMKKLVALLDDTTDDTTDDTADDGDTADTGDADDDAGGADDEDDSFFNLPDGDVFSQEPKEGGDCGDMFKQVDTSFETYSAQLTTFDGQVKQFGDDFTASGLEQVYTVEDLKGDDGGKYAFHYKLTKKEQAEGDTANPALAFLPDFELAGGASENEIAMKIKTSMDFTKDATPGGDAGDDAAGDDADGAMTIKMTMGYELYANIPEKTMSLGFDVDANIKQGTDEKAIKASGTSTIKGGDLPAMTVAMKFEGTDPEDKAVSGDLTYGIEKVSADEMKMTWKGTFGDQKMDQTISITRTGTTCKIGKVGA